MNRKNRKLYRRPIRVLKPIAIDTPVNSSLESRQQSYKSWNHVPVLEWSQSNLPPRPAETCFRNITFRSRSFNGYSKNPGRFHNSIHSEFTAHNFLGTTSEATLEWSQSNLPSRPAETCFRNITFRSRSFNEYSKNPGRFHNSTRSEFTARNFTGTTSEATASPANFKSDNYSTRSMGNALSLTSYAKCLSGANMDGKGKQVNSAISNNSENCKEDDDVMYLFSVDSLSESKMFLEIDLQSDGVNLIPSSSPPKAPKSKNEDDHDQSIVIIAELEFDKPRTRKRKLSKSNDKTSKRPSHRPRCAACKISYDDVTAKKQNMFISSSCSHVFCGPCISKDEKSKVCPACKIKFIAFRRLYV